jgi:hypothetical protein
MDNLTARAPARARRLAWLALAALAAVLFGSVAPAAAGAAAPPSPAPPPPGALRIRVAHGGMQRLTGAALAAAGLPLAGLDPARLRLTRGGAEIALEARGTADGRLDPDDELWFYAPPPGDRWNDSDTYWLSVGGTPGLRMAARSVAPGAAPARDTALERGIWHESHVYDSWLPGPDGDHWFAARLSTDAGAPPATFPITLPQALPPAAEPLTATLSGAAFTAGEHRLEIASVDLRWYDLGNWQRTSVFAAGSGQIQLSLTPGNGPDIVYLDSLRWERLVRLSPGGRGARFDGVPGRWRYQIDGLAPDQALYDISDPWAPVQLTGLAGGFEDGPAPRSYLLSGAGALFTPVVSAAPPPALPTDADALYIAPAEFHAALAPLVALRRAQGLQAAVVDVQAIYDAWSGGQVAPDAIRDFLRYARATWRRPPRYVTLVGDGTSDPRNYTGRNNRNLIPPYMAMVDLWMGETACEGCYAQLDGDSPLDDLTPDVALGRLPVKSEAELRAVVAKIIAYEADAGGVGWRSRALVLADNARQADGRPDLTGDFAAYAERSVGYLPAGIAAQRIYYDPWQRDANGLPLNEPWRDADSARLHQRVLAALNSGVGLVTYIGHGHQWQWADTDPHATPNYMLGFNDPAALRNGRATPIVLAMTCLSSAFQEPAYSGTTIDERLVLQPDGGAVAVLGSTGQGVLRNHDLLQQGFHRALWAAPPGTARLGDLMRAGLETIIEQASGYKDVVRTYVLLGDPLTTPRLAPAQRTFLPLAVQP